MISQFTIPLVGVPEDNRAAFIDAITNIPYIELVDNITYEYDTYGNEKKAIAYFRVLGSKHLLMFRTSTGNNVWLEITRFDGLTLLRSPGWFNSSGGVTITTTLSISQTGIYIRCDGWGDGPPKVVEVGCWMRNSDNSISYIDSSGPAAAMDDSDILYGIDFPYFKFKTDYEKNLLIPCYYKSALNKLLSSRPLGVYGTRPFSTNNTFFTFFDGTTGYYKNNILYR